MENIEELGKELPNGDLSTKDNRSHRKKIIIKVFCLAIAVVLGLYALVSVGDFITGGLGAEKFDLSVKQDGIYYFPEDYSTDINERLLYTVKERRIYFVDASGVGEFLTGDNPVSFGKAGELFIKYFDALVDGDALAFNKLFTDGYFKAHVNPERFTPQMVYDIKVEFYNSQLSDEGFIERYVVSFKIMENNGSFRADVRSDAAKPLVFEVLVGELDARISSVYPVINQ